MYEQSEDCFYYITIYNENYVQPPMPEGIANLEEGILRGIYKYRSAPGGKANVHLWGSGPMLNDALKAQHMLAEKFGVQADVWSVTSYNELRREALECERWNRLHPDQAPKRPYIQQVMDGQDGPIVASSDYMKLLADQLAQWLPGRLETLGTDGFGRSDNREHLRHHFEIDAVNIVGAALSKLSRWNWYDAGKAAEALWELGLDPESVNPVKK
jgi:pyruvate dehydrogenase E1 component